jgi:hypothetical protein
LITQTRDNIGFGSKFDPKTYSGGKALKFWATLQIWFAVRSHMKKTVMGKERELGIVARARVKKNRIDGKDRTIDFKIYHSHGIDDIGSCVDWLVEEGHWGEVRGKITVPEFDFEGTDDKLIQKIEEEGREEELRQLVGNVWITIEDACAVKRKSRYGS